MVLAALLLPFLGSLAGKMASKLLSSNDSTTKTPDFRTLLGGGQVAQAPPATTGGGALTAADRANALAIGRGAEPGATNFSRQAASLYEEHQAP